jgi:hypothetical protein
MKSTDFIVARRDLQQCKFIETRLPDANALPDGALLVKIDRFAFTANNITYAQLGDLLKYWQLFPAPDDFGNIPVWGFGEVIASRHPAVEVGERLFGYFPMATHLVIEASSVSKRGLRDAAAHRQDVAPVYNAYARVGNDPAFAGRPGDYQALLRPLFMLSFLVDDFLGQNDFFGAREVVISSASSKAAFGLAHLLHTTLHRHFGDRMMYSARIGLTHRSASPDEGELPGAAPVWFFAPDQIRKRAREWGPGGVEQRFGAAWSTFAPTLEGRLTVVESRGPAAVKQVYLDTLNGHIPPEQGHMLSLTG